MNNQIISHRLKLYQPKTIEEEENALKEILQEIALFALSTTDFFTKALFQGGTSLRILYQLPRFSEDLDFLLKKPDKNFQWKKYIEIMKKVFILYGIEPEIIDRGKESKTIHKLFIKDNSIGKILNLNFHHHINRKFLIKFEIDTNPPAGSKEEIKYLDFPIDYAIIAQDLPSNFAGKCHAILCREYVKSRDWFDFSWYVAKGTSINFKFLENALNQSGPWQNKQIKITKEWVITELKQKTNTVDWQKAAMEMQRFIEAKYKDTLSLWGRKFFLAKIQKLSTYL
ncbi:MAG: hypothetical protein A3E87_04160 [Gammaproteobacteria bacterium RIFCSPHIGHO2_12_FULL_35_23]|nr:MAG: hypothetical protein A3E87_04160 [Gammaproteobacteria bacterium RIFCSPHIGHO2_12_FULL_35_23]